ncbi:alcohol dehydrogenase catalytic domain-containing protein [Streptomyces sp. NPDC050164]|uniref:alcohol dehydrogenase catalytic domain-containing protein n=1 Tax=Streptomyces sp. NPDC050164 TaxID=3365605 RepID=UPI003799F5B9
MRATAALLEQPGQPSGQPFVLTEVDLDEPRPDDVLVRVATVDICGTDLDFVDPFFPTPALLGQEEWGDVEEAARARCASPARPPAAAASTR